MMGNVVMGNVVMGNVVMAGDGDGQVMERG